MTSPNQVVLALGDTTPFNLTQEQVLTLCITGLPYPQHIDQIDLSVPDHIRIKWRQTWWYISCTYLDVGESRDGFSHGSEASILMSHLLKLEWVRRSTAGEYDQLPVASPTPSKTAMYEAACGWEGTPWASTKE